MKMGKRSDFERIPKDFYKTPYEAVIPLLPHLTSDVKYIEPCCGDGVLIKHLNRNCVASFDSEVDATKYKLNIEADYFITNPPWSRDILHPIIENLSNQLPTWLLFDADWMHTRQSGDLIKRCCMIISVGRIKWIPNSTMTGKDNCCWYLFNKNVNHSTMFMGRK
jgi:hypothetical protein